MLVGWKKVKEAYRIKHLVCVSTTIISNGSERTIEKKICIGSPYIHDIIIIGMDGVVKKRDDGKNNADLARYQREFDENHEKLKALVLADDSFVRSIPVYTYHNGEIIEKFCEEPGWPNVTHDGMMMYENTYSINRAEVVQFAKDDVDAGIRLLQRRIDEMKLELVRTQEELKVEKNNREKLDKIEL